jgi:WD40 repeat protein
VSVREYGWVTLYDGTGKAAHRLGGAVFRHYYGLAFSPDGKMLATSVGNFRPSGIELWDVATGGQVRQVSEDIASCLRFTPDGKTLVGSRGSTIRFWDVGTGAAQGQINGLGTNVNCLAISHDGKWLAAGCGDTTVLILPTEARTAPR